MIAFKETGRVNPALAALLQRTSADLDSSEALPSGVQAGREAAARIRQAMDDVRAEQGRR